MSASFHSPDNETKPSVLQFAVIAGIVIAVVLPVLPLIVQSFAHR